MGDEVKFLWRDAEAGEDSHAIGLVNSFLEGVRDSGLSEDFKLHVVQGDNKIDFNIAIKAHKGLPSDQKDTILKRVRALRAPDFGAANTWIYNSFDLDLEIFHSEDPQDPIFFDMFIRFSTVEGKNISTNDKLKEVGGRAGKCFSKAIHFLFDM